MESDPRPDKMRSEEANRPGQAEALPPWIGQLGVAVWVRDTSGNISYVNDRAEKMLGVKAEDCVGRACYDVIGGVDDEGRPICRPDCETICLARAGRVLEPVSMRINGPDRKDVHIRVMLINVQTDGVGSPFIVHCALGAEREHGLTEFFDRVASRTSHLEPGRLMLKNGALTDRELEVLNLLASDETLHSIALRLNISYTTVRNHVQHVLAKLGVHSIMEAVACYLLTTNPPDDEGSRPGI